MRLTSCSCLGLLALVLSLSGCALNPQPSHGAENSQAGVSVYGTIDMGVSRQR